MKRGLKIVLIVGIIIAVLVIITVIYFTVSQQSPSKIGNNSSNQDYSAGTNVGDNIGKATTANAFDKLNPFRG